MQAEQIQTKTLILCLAAILCTELARWIVDTEHLYDRIMSLGAARLLEIVMISLVVEMWGKGFSTIGLTRSKIFSGFKKGLTWSAGFGILTSFAFIGLSISGFDPWSLIKTPLPVKQSNLLIFIMVGGIVAPVAEELFFRGILYGFFRRWGVIVALILSTLLFVLPHVGYQGLPITQTVGGILFAIAYEVQGSLMTPITIHALGNMAIFTISLLY